MALETSLREVTKLRMLSINFTPQWEDFEDPVKQRFEEIYPNITVDLAYEPTVDEVHDKIVATLKAEGAEYDVFLVDNMWIPEFVEAGLLTDVTEYITPEIRSSIFPEVLKAAEYPAGSGRYYAVPWYMDTKYLFYNEAMLRKAGIKEPPKTLDELWRQATIIKNKGIVKYPFVWSWALNECVICDYIILATLFGGRLVDETGRPAFNEGGAVTALEWMRKSINEKLTSWASLAFTEFDVSRVFSAGDAAFTLLWLPSYEGMNNPEALAGACRITHIPGSDILPEGVSVNGSTFFGISPNCKSKDAAVKLAKFWAGLDSKGNYVKWFFPTWMQMFEVPKIFREGVYDILDVVKYQYAHLINRPRIPKYAVLSKELQRAIHKALTEVKTPQEALNEAAERFASQL